MDIQALTQYFLQYGAVFIFVIVLLEYLNLPGFPAGVIMPLAGIWAARGQIGLGMALLLALAAAYLGGSTTGAAAGVAFGAALDLDTVRSGKAGRPCAAGTVFKEVSGPAAGHREELCHAGEAGCHRNLYQ